MTETVTLVGAVRAALADAMEEDPRLVLMGEDVGRNGGVFRATEGLFDRFGERRVIDTPISELSMAGWGVGRAAMGCPTVVEFQFSGFMYPALEQILSHAARITWRSRGKMPCPLVVRAPFGGGVHAPEHHSESMEAIWAHIPGLNVLIPSTPQDAYDLIRWACAHAGPSVVLEPKRLYRTATGPLERRPPDRDIWPRPAVRREGRDVTMVTWGASTKEALAAAERLAEEGTDVELIDFRVLRPFDPTPVLESVRKTGRLVIVHEAPRTGGFGAEIAATVAERAVQWLTAPVRRVTGHDVPTPYPRLERYQIPSVERVVRVVHEVLWW